jgi:AcrR family transcriptional regulator
MRTADRRTDIMQATLELIAEQGFHGAPMAQIAARAEVAAGTIYRYFAGRDVLITELYRELESRITTSLRKDYPTEKPLRERFLFLVRGLVSYFIENPLHFRYMEQYFNSPYGISLRRDKLLGKPDSEDVLIAVLAEGVSHRILKDFPTGVLLALAVGPLIILIRDHIFGFVALDENLIMQTTRACWDAIKIERTEVSHANR